MIGDFVAHYESLGWVLAPLYGDAQHPGKDWPTRVARLAPHEIENANGLSVILGPSGVVDIDLDCDEARTLAPRMLRPTDRFGRNGRVTHYVYSCAAAPHPKNGGPDGQAKTRKFVWGARDVGDVHSTIVEIRRGPGHQSVFPPSLKPGGSRLAWVESDANLTEWDAEDEARVEDLALACILLRSSWCPGRHDSVLQFAGEMARRGLPLDRCLSIVGHACSARGDEGLADRARSVEDTYARHSRGDAVVGIADAATLKALDSVLGRTIGGAGRPRINLNGPQDEVLRLVENVLVSAQPPIVFRQGDGLVTLDGPCSADRLNVEVGRLAAVCRSSKDGDKPAWVPNDLMKRVLSAPPRGLPILRGRRSTPIVAPDGSVRVNEGYDDSTQLWCDGWKGPPVRTDISLDEARAALESVLAFVDAGQWMEPSDALSWLAHVVTIAARPAIKGPVPTWVYTACRPGSGKSALATLAGIIGARCDAGFAPASLEQVELARTLDDYSIAPSVVLENMRGKFKSTVLENAVTKGELRVRRLYLGPVNIEWSTVMSITSNGAEIGNDWIRRSMPVRLNGNKLPKADIIWQARRKLYLTSYVTSVAASMLSQLGKYEGEFLPGFSEWSRVVGGIFWSVFHTDIIKETREAVSDLAPDQEGGSEILDLLEEWMKATNRTTFKARDAWSDPRVGARLAERFRSVENFGRTLRRLSDATRVVRWETKRNISVYTVGQW